MSTYITAIEIGSSKIIGAVAKVSDGNNVNIVAIEEQPLQPGSVRYGCVTNVEEVSSKLNIVKRLLENNPGIAPGKITGAYISLGGRSLSSHPVEASRSFGQETEITENVVFELKNQVKNDCPPNKQYLDSVPLTYIIDGKKISLPVGTLGYQIRARYNLIVCDDKIYRNIKTAFDKIGLKIIGGIARILAVDSLILTKNQRDLGCAVIDLGAETTTIAIYKENTLKFLVTIPMGSRLITKDLAAVLNVTEERAEELKMNHVNLSTLNDEENITIDRTLDNLDYKLINNIVKARVSEIISNIQYQINQSHIKSEELTEGVILIGKGSRLNGLRDLLKKNTGLKIAYPSSNENIQFSSHLSVPVSEALDVVAVIVAASHHRPAVQCVEIPQTSTGPIIEDIPQNSAPKKESNSETHKTGEKQPGWVNRFARSFMDMLSSEGDFDADEEQDR